MDVSYINRQLITALRAGTIALNIDVVVNQEVKNALNMILKAAFDDEMNVFDITHKIYVLDKYMHATSGKIIWTVYDSIEEIEPLNKENLLACVSIESFLKPTNISQDVVVEMHGIIASAQSTIERAFNVIDTKVENYILTRTLSATTEDAILAVKDELNAIYNSTTPITNTHKNLLTIIAHKLITL
jgi:hypothetical protein